MSSEVLEDKAYHGILEALFCAAKVECSTYANTSKSVSKAKSASRLSEYANVLCLAVRVGVRKLRFKTVRALLEHVSQTLPTSDGAYCEPLVVDYFKALRAVLEYPPHPEHLSKEEWHDAMDFCNSSLHDLNVSSSDKSLSSSNSVRGHGSFTDLPSRTVTPELHSNNGRNTSSRGSKIMFNPQLRGAAEDIVFCVRHLASVTNAPILEKPSVTLDALLDLLQMSPSLGITQQAAFESINSIMIRISTDDTPLVIETLTKLIPLVRRFWQAKSAGLKELLTSMIHGEAYLARLLKNSKNGDSKADLLGLLEVLRSEYCKRLERDQLQLDDLDLSDHTFRSDRDMPLSTQAYELRSGATKAEQPWVLLHITASVLVAIQDEEFDHRLRHENVDHDPPSKRQRLTGALDDILLLTKAPTAPERLYALQTLVFVFDCLAMDRRTLRDVVDNLLSCASDENALIASWAIMALTSCVFEYQPDQSDTD